MERTILRQKNEERDMRTLTGKKIRKQNRKTRRKSSLGSLLSEASPVSKQHLSEKAFLCTLKRGCIQIKKTADIRKASLTIEAALVLPLFFFGLITMISFMDIYKVQTEHLSKLCQQAKEAGMYAYTPDGEGPEEITLLDFYVYKPISPGIPLPAIWMHNTVKVHAWTGTVHRSASEEDTQKTETMVYVTESGTVYHKNLNCSHLKLSVVKVSGSSVSGMRNEYGEKYHACEGCSRGQKPGSSVYITKSGNRYHNKKECSGLKRSVRLVKESDVENMHACSRCG